MGLTHHMFSHPRGVDASYLAKDAYDRRLGFDVEVFHHRKKNPRPATFSAMAPASPKKKASASKKVRKPGCFFSSFVRSRWSGKNRIRFTIRQCWLEGRPRTFARVH